MMKFENKLKPLHKTKVAAWRGISNTFFFGSYFFKEVTTTGFKS